MSRAPAATITVYGYDSCMALGTSLFLFDLLVRRFGSGAGEAAGDDRFDCKSGVESCIVGQKSRGDPNYEPARYREHVLAIRDGRRDDFFFCTCRYNIWRENSVRYRGFIRGGASLIPKSLPFLVCFAKVV